MSQSHLLLDPLRIVNIKLHRMKVNGSSSASSTRRPTSRGGSRHHYEIQDPSAVRRKLSLDNHKEMDLSGMREQHNLTLARYTQLTIIEEPFIDEDFPTTKNFLMEDDKKMVCTVRVKGLPDNENTKEMFAVGMTHFVVACEVTGMYCPPPGQSDKYLITINSSQLDQIFPIGKKIDMCRYCGKENATQKCSDCKVPYCSRECQVTDWKTLKHKLVCKKVES